MLSCFRSIPVPNRVSGCPVAHQSPVSLRDRKAHPSCIPATQTQAFVLLPAPSSSSHAPPKKRRHELRLMPPAVCLRPYSLCVAIVFDTAPTARLPFQEARPPEVPEAHQNPRLAEGVEVEVAVAPGDDAYRLLPGGHVHGARIPCPRAPVHGWCGKLAPASTAPASACSESPAENAHLLFRVQLWPGPPCQFDQEFCPRSAGRHS